MHSNFCRVIAVLALPALLSGCGDDGSGEVAAQDNTVTPVASLAAQDDTFTVKRIASLDVLANDRLNGEAARAGPDGNVVLSLEDPPSGVQLAGSADALVITDLPPGEWRLAYRICEAANKVRCATARATVNVRLDTLAATDDELELWIDGPAANVLDNDTETSSPLRPLVAGQFSTVEATGTLPPGIMLSTSGWLVAGAEAAPGRWEIGYRVCQTGYADGCAMAVARVTVPSQALLTGRVAEGAWVGAPGAATVAKYCDYTNNYADCGAFELRADATGVRSVLNIGRPGEFAEPESEARLTPNDYPLVLTPGRIVQIRQIWSQPVTQFIPYRGDAQVMPNGAGWEAVASGAALRWEGFWVDEGYLVDTPHLLMLTALQAGSEPRMLPGDYSAQVNGQVLPVEIFAAAHLESMAMGYDGNPGEPRTPEAAVLSIAVSTRQAVLPAQATLFLYDEASARWRARGTANRLLNDGVTSYEGAVDRPGTWAAGRLVDAVVVTGSVRDVAGLPVAGARVSADGLDHSLRTETLSGVDGSFTLQVPRASRSRIEVRNAGAISSDIVASTVDVGPLSAATHLADALQAEGPARLTMTTTATPRDDDYYGCSGDVLQVEIHAPDGSKISASKLTRPLVGAYRVYMARSLGGCAGYQDYGKLWPAVTAIAPGQAPITVSAPRLLGKVGEIPGFWWLAEIEVDAACAVTVRRRLEPLDTLPTPAVAPARHCTG
jgi:hypothetical protein